MHLLAQKYANRVDANTTEATNSGIGHTPTVSVKGKESQTRTQTRCRQRRCRRQMSTGTAVFLMALLADNLWPLIERLTAEHEAFDGTNRVVPQRM